MFAEEQHVRFHYSPVDPGDPDSLWSFAPHLLADVDPGRPGRRSSSPAATPRPPQGTIDAELHRFRLDEGFWAQYWDWLKGIVHGDWGPALDKNANIFHDMMRHFGVTTRLVVLALIVAIVLAVHHRCDERDQAVQRPRLHVHVPRLRVPVDADVLDRAAAQDDRGQLQPVDRYALLRHPRGLLDPAAGWVRGTGSRLRRPPDAADDLAGTDHVRRPEPVPARLDARGDEQRLRSPGAGQGHQQPARADPPHAADGADSDDDRHRR